MNVLIGTAAFISILILIEVAYLAVRRIQNPEKKAIRRRLNSLPAAGKDDETIDISRKIVLSEVPWLHRILSSVHWGEGLQTLLEQSGTQHRLGFFVLVSSLLAVSCFWIGLLATSHYLLLLPGVAFSGTLPFLYIYFKKGRRMRKFERQLPDALDLLARSLRAGHAFSGGLKMVADEFDNPIGIEFEKTMSEINFGVGIQEALKNLSKRVDCLDLSFFSISVIIQRETGGNLAEILENIARLIRERFKLHGRIRTLAAEGKLSAIILIALPFFLAGIISILNPGYIQTLITDPIGPVLIVVAIIMMIFGVITMSRMVKIKV